MKMLVTEWDYDLEKEVVRDEAREEIINSMYQNGLTVEAIAKIAKISERRVKEILGL
jgi:DNA-directed RNA polymerase specialized sigma subunit